jgi:hypothetical protein
LMAPILVRVRVRVRVARELGLGLRTLRLMAPTSMRSLTLTPTLTLTLTLTTSAKEMPSRCSSAMVLISKRRGARRWKRPSRMMGRMKVTKPSSPGRSSPLEMRTSASASPATIRDPSCNPMRSTLQPYALHPATPPAREREKAASAARVSVGCCSRAARSESTSSSAELTPSPKYGFTVWMASPSSTVEPPWCSAGPTYLARVRVRVGVGGRVRARAP